MSAIPKISVVMGVYNGEGVVGKAVESVLSQENADFEFIIVNDGSTDETGAILDKFSARDHRIRVIHQKNNGLSKALIKGCALASGTYIARQDADDVSFPGRLRAQSDLLDRNHSVVLVSCWSTVIGPQGEFLYVERRPADPGDATQLLLEGRSGPPGHGSVMFRKAAYEKVGGYRPEFYYAQDSDLWLRLASEGQFAYLQKEYYAYEISPLSMSGGLHSRKLEYAKLIDECFELRNAGLDDQPAINEFIEGNKSNQSVGDYESSIAGKESRFRTNYFIGRCLLKNRDKRARRYFTLCVKSKPLSPRAWVNFMLAVWISALGWPSLKH